MRPAVFARDRVGRHLEQTICIHLLNEWASRADLDRENPRKRLAPRAVRLAEQYMAIMRRVHFFGSSDMQGVRRDLCGSAPGQSVSSVAYAWAT